MESMTSFIPSKKKSSSFFAVIAMLFLFSSDLDCNVPKVLVENFSHFGQNVLINCARIDNHGDGNHRIAA